MLNKKIFFELNQINNKEKNEKNSNNRSVGSNWF
ncbi:hypothetical protein ES707_18122 [subsurface metagenome]